VILVRIAHVPVGGDQTGHGVEASGALLELSIGSYAKSRTLIPARRISMHSSGNCSVWPMSRSYAISVAAEEASLGQ